MNFGLEGGRLASVSDSNPNFVILRKSVHFGLSFTQMRRFLNFKAKKVI